MFTAEEREKIISAREKFIKEGKKDYTNVRKIVVDSWIRSSSFNLNYDEAKAPVISGEKLEHSLEKNRYLIETAKPYMEKLLSFVKGTGFRVMLADSDGCMLFYIGDLVPVGDLEEPIAGTIYSEEKVGTNSIGTCLTIDEPVQIWAEEHYCKKYRILNGSGAPIHNSKGDIIGCLNMAAIHHKVHLHTLGMVVAATDAIEREIKLKEAYREQYILSSKQIAAFQVISEAILIADDNGDILEMNRAAKLMLNVEINESRKINIYDFIVNKNRFKEIIIKNNELIDEEVTIKINNKELVCLVCSSNISDENEKSFGWVITLKEMKSVNKLVNRITGANAHYTLDSIIGESKEINEVKQLAKIASHSTSNVLISGESGTGKELIAQSIHNLSERKDKPFIAINCGAIPRGLIESELFGYEAGAFTGANKSGNPGKFELAEGGTVFLDEIGDMPFEVQVTLLRVIQEKMILRVGGKKPKPINVRIIAATNKDLREEVNNKNFREDLYYRLNVLSIRVPPLIERKQDIKILANFFLSKFTKKLDKKVFEFEDAVYRVLENYSWKGNIRELENVIERAVNITQDQIISLDCLPKHIITQAKITPEEVKFQYIEQKERDLIKNVIEEQKGNLKRSSEILGIARSTLYEKIKKYKIDYTKYR